MLQMIPQISALISIAYIFHCKYAGVLNLCILFIYVVIIIIIMLHCAFIMKYCFVISVVLVVITGCFMMVSQSSWHTGGDRPPHRSPNMLLAFPSLLQDNGRLWLALPVPIISETMGEDEGKVRRSSSAVKETHFSRNGSGLLT